MIIKSVKLLIATIGLSLGSAAITEDLVFAVTGKAGSVWYYDAETVRRYPNNTVEFWAKEDASKNKTVRYRTSRYHWRMDCSAETMGSLGFVDYRADGTVIQSDYYKNPEMVPGVPGSIGQELFEIMCSK